MIERCAQGLMSALRLKPGERFGIILPNIPEFTVVIYGAMRAGLVVTFANPLYTAGNCYTIIFKYQVGILRKRPRGLYKLGKVGMA